jgi:hypothetical protein
MNLHGFAHLKTPVEDATLAGVFLLPPRAGPVKGFPQKFFSPPQRKVTGNAESVAGMRINVTYNPLHPIRRAPRAAAGAPRARTIVLGQLPTVRRGRMASRKKSRPARRPAEAEGRGWREEANRGVHSAPFAICMKPLEARGGAIIRGSVLIALVIATGAEAPTPIENRMIGASAAGAPARHRGCAPS